MHQRFFGSIACAALIAIGGAAYGWQAANYRNIPGPITGSYSGGINGSFRFTAVTAPNGIPSAPSGGACIVFRAKDLGFEKMERKRCRSDNDCSTPGENEYGYCDTQNNKCWARPLIPSTGPNPEQYLCLRGTSPRFPTPVPIDADIAISATPAPISTPSWKIKPNAKARVLSRLNCSTTGCAPDGHDYVLEWGDPEQL